MTQRTFLIIYDAFLSRAEAGKSGGAEQTFPAQDADTGIILQKGDSLNRAPKMRPGPAPFTLNFLMLNSH